MRDELKGLEPYIDIKELLKLIPISDAMIRKECNKIENPMPHTRIGNRYAFKWSLVDAWLSQNCAEKH